MSAIFISYTGRDPEGDAWADRLVEWFEEWNYGFFRDKDHSHGIKAGEEWRPALYRSLASAQVMVCLCSKQYENSAWCVGEMAIAHRDGKSVIPIHLARTASGLKSNPLPSMLQTQQAIKITSALKPTAAQLKEAKQRLQHRLKETLKWRELLDWDVNQQPYPGLLSFSAQQAPVFYGQDAAIKTLREELAGLAQRAPAALVVLGASGTGKSSLVRAGVVPRLAAEPERWLLLEPLRPGRFPFEELKQVLAPALAALPERLPAVKREKQEAALQRQLDWLSAKGKRPVVMVIDQLEELLVDDNTEATEFLDFVERLLQRELCGVVVLATLRTDFLALLEARRPVLTGLMQPTTPEAIQPQRFGELISGPAMRAQLKLQPGLAEELVAESKGSDALPLLAYTLEQLWKRRQERGTMVKVADGSLVDITLDDLKAVGGVDGAVSHQASLCWNPLTTSEADTRELQQVFVRHLVRLNDEGLATKQPARWDALPPASRPLLKRFVEARLLVSGGGEAGELVEIAHEALLRTWEPLKQWIETGRHQLEQRRRIERLCADLGLNHPLQTRLAALQGLLPLVEADPEAGVNAAKAVEALLTDAKRDPQEWLLGIRLLGLAGGETSAAALCTFLEQQQLSDFVETQQAAPVLEALCQAAAALQHLHRANPPREVNDERWLLMPSATINDNGRAFRTQLVRLRLWALPRLQVPGAWFELLGDSVALTMVGIPAGCYWIGSPRDELGRFTNEGPERLVALEGFWISQTPITQAQWRQVMGSNPSNFIENRVDRDLRPVEKVSWHDAIEFCTRLREHAGRIYTLPTEAQWEYACRAGSTAPFHYGATLISELANYNANAIYGGSERGGFRSQTSPVSQFPSNDWGLHDMHGNVREWCLDQWQDSYDDKPSNTQAFIVSDNHKAVVDETTCLVRGGSWHRSPRHCRSAVRDYAMAARVSSDIGFRVICIPQDST